MKIHKTGSNEFSKHVKMLVAGQPGSGKTRFASTFPNPVFANALGGLMSIAEKGVRYVDIHSEADMLQMKMMLDGFGVDTEEHFHGPVETLVVDTLDEFQRILLSERLASQKRSETTAGDWGWLSQRMHTIVEGLVRLPMNVVFVTHIKDVSDGITGQLFFKPSLQGSFCDHINQYVDFSLLVQAQHYKSGGPEIVEELGRDPFLSEDQATHIDYRFIRSYPCSMNEWVKDLSGSLPPELELNFQNDFDTLKGFIDEKRQTLPESETYDVPEDNAAAAASDLTSGVPVDTYIAQVRKNIDTSTKTEEVEPTATPVAIESAAESSAGESPIIAPCTDCGNSIENQDRVDLSMIRYRVPLCAECFNGRRNNN